MAGDSQQAQEALWYEIAQEREEADSSPSDAPAIASAAATEAEEVEPAEQGQGSKPGANATPVADPYEGLKPEVVAKLRKLDELAAAVPQLSQSVKTAEGRVAAMQRELDVARNAAKAAPGGPSQAQIAAAGANTHKWDRLKEDFPEWADATEELLKARLAGVSQSQAARLDPQEINRLVEQRVAGVREEAFKAIEVARVEGRHEGWQDEVKTDSFMQWFNAQPTDVKALAASEKARDAIRMLDLYQEAKSKPVSQVQQGRAAKLAAAVTAKPGVGSAATKSVDDMTPQELWEYERKRAAKRGESRGLAY